MGVRSYLKISKNNIYYFRRVVPLKLRTSLGKREIKISLRTRSRQKALVLVGVLYLKTEQLFYEYGGKLMSLLDLIYELGERGYDAKELDDIVFTVYGTEASNGVEGTSFVRMKASQRKAVVESVSESHGTEMARALATVMTYISESKKKNHAELKSLVNESLGLDAVLKDEELDLRVTEPSLSQEKHSERLTIGVLVEEYITHRPADLEIRLGKTDWEIPSKELKALRQMREILGDELYVDEVGRKKAKYVMATFCKLPSDHNKYVGKSVSEILESMPKEEPVLLPQTVNDYLGYMVAIFNYAIEELELTGFKNPFVKKMRRAEPDKKDARSSFTDNELKLIFEGEVFTEFDYKKHKPHVYWAPLIALYTGARNNEIGSLCCSDITQVFYDDGKPVVSKAGMPLWLIGINENPKVASGKKRIKNTNSKRNVPIHPRLIELGFLEYCEVQRKKGTDNMLFDYLVFNKRNGYGGLIGRNFNDYLKKIDVWVRLKKVFYSFRHTIYDHLNNAGVVSERRELIAGRSSNDKAKTTGERVYGNKNAVKALNIYDDVLKMDFEFALTKVKPFYEMEKASQKSNKA